jgi:hypothetical protein
MDFDEARKKLELFEVTTRYENNLIAFDYETNMIKPHSSQSEIVCVSFSNGVQTLAVPWFRDLAPIVIKILTNPCKKVAANLKFEANWTRAKLGIEVKNWSFDSMLLGHCLDNRKGTKSVKFQSFAMLGFPDYADRIKPYLKCGGTNTPNRIRQIPLKELLTYCGLDSFLELKIVQWELKKGEMPCR